VYVVDSDLVSGLLTSDDPTGSRREVGRLVTSGHRIWSRFLTPIEVHLPISRVDRKLNYEKPVPPALRFPPGSPGYLTSRKSGRESGRHSPNLRTEVTEQQAFALSVAVVPFSTRPVLPIFPMNSVFSMKPAPSALFESPALFKFKEARP
jgi:hypothetical protein